MTNTSKSVSMSKQQQTGPSPWVVGGLAAVGGATVGVMSVNAYYSYHDKKTPAKEQLEAAEAILASGAFRPQ